MQHISKNQVKYIRSLQQKKVRDAEGVFVAEGHKCIEELIRHFPLKLLVVSQVDDTWTHSRHIVDSAWELRETSARPQADLIVEATPSEIEQISSLKTPQGVVAVFQRFSSGSPAVLPTLSSSANLLSRKEQENSLILALDGVQDPGNLGTIIRTADWFGIRHIVCSRDTADCWNPKVVQATMGALARVQLHYTNLVGWIGEQRGCAASRAAALPVPIYGTLLDGVNMYAPGAIPKKQNGIIIMGNEGNGISPEVRALITHPLFIPSYHSSNSIPSSVSNLSSSETIESLNVAIATAVILAEFRR